MTFPFMARNPWLACVASFIACLAAFPGRAMGQSTALPDPPAFRVVGYLPDYRVPGFDFSEASGLTDLILFSAEPTAEGSLDLSRLKAVRWPEFHALRSRQRTRIHLAVGGWGLSRHFKAVSGTATLRSHFVQQVLQTASDLKLDGIDLDWEHPANPAEEEAYGLLLADLRQALAPRGLSLFVTIAGWQKLTPLAIRSADLVQLMAYDQPGPHSTFEGARADLAKLAHQGIPRARTVLGLPFYGRHRTQREQTLTYHEIVQRFAPAATTDEVQGFAFNGPDTIRRKVALARDEGLAGVMAWELGQDAPGHPSLLKAIVAEATSAPAVLMTEGRRAASQAFQALGQSLLAALAQGGPTNAIEVCAIRAMPLTQALGQTNRLVLQRISHAPRNPANAASPQEREWIARFQSELRLASNAPASALPPAPILRTNALGQPVFYSPIVLANPLCLQCHGDPRRDIAPATLKALQAKYPADQATGFRLGDVRGLWKAELARDR